MTQDDGKTDILKDGQPTGRTTPEIHHPDYAQFQGFPNGLFFLIFRWLFDPLWDFTYLYADEPDRGWALKVRGSELDLISKQTIPARGV